MKWIAAYFVGGVVALTAANWILYPVPNWLGHLHGVALGLFAAAVFLTGSACACVILLVAQRKGPGGGAGHGV